MLPDETEDEFVTRIRLKDVPADAIDVYEVEETTIPSSRTFRGAWRIGAGGGVEIDMPVARAIKMESIRRERDLLLAQTDVEIAKLDGSNPPPALIAKRQALRDLPATIQGTLDAIMTPDELERYQP